MNVSAALPSLPQVGDVLGQYRLTSLLGEGAMGTVFRAEHTLLAREVAVKVLLPVFAERTDVVYRFFKEAQVVNQIHHANLINIVDLVAEPDHLPYLVMELLEGRTLMSLIREQAPMAVEAVVAIVRQVCDALSALHAIGIVHRDLKPENIFVNETPEGVWQVKLLDFGVAKFMAAGDAAFQTMTGDIIGTPEYMAPEQITGGAVDHRIDVYATGMILFEMLTGELPFPGTQISEILYHHINTPPGSPSVRRQSRGAGPLPYTLEDAVLACLAKEMDYRVQSMSQLQELLEWSVEEGDSVVVLHDPETEVNADSRRRRRRLSLAALFSLIAVSVVLGGLWVYHNHIQRNDEFTGGRARFALLVLGRMHVSPASFRAEDVDPGSRATEPGREVLIQSQPEAADIYRLEDGRYLGRTPRSVYVRGDGPVTLQLFKRGHVPQLFTLPDDHQGTLVLIRRRAAVASQASPPVRRWRRRRGSPRRVNMPAPRSPGVSSDTGTVNPFE